MAHARDDAGVSSPPAYYDFTLRFPSFTLFVYNHSFTEFRFQEDPVADGERYMQVPQLLADPPLSATFHSPSCVPYFFPSLSSGTPT